VSCLDPSKHSFMEYTTCQWRNHGWLTQLCRDGELADKTILRYYFLLPIPFDFTQIPLCGNISTAQVVSLARRQVLYRRSCQLNSGVSWKRAAGLVIHVRLDRTGVHREDLDARILYRKAMSIWCSIRMQDETIILVLTNGNKLCKTKHCVLRDAVLARVWYSKLGRR